MHGARAAHLLHRRSPVQLAELGVSHAQRLLLAPQRRLERRPVCVRLCELPSRPRVLCLQPLVRAGLRHPLRVVRELRVRIADGPAHTHALCMLRVLGMLSTPAAVTLPDPCGPEPPAALHPGAAAAPQGTGTGA